MPSHVTINNRSFDLLHAPLEYVLYILCVLFLFSCNDSNASHEDTELPFLKTQGADTTRTVVKTAWAKEAPFNYLIQSSGKVRSLHERIVSSEIGGSLLLNHAFTGKQVLANEVILKIDPTLIQYRLKKAEFSLFNNEKEYQSQLLGYESLLKDKPALEAENIRKKLKISSGLLPAQQEISEAQYELSKTVIRAPFTGVLSDVRIEAGQQIRPEQQLFRIYDPHNLLLEIKILEADLFLLKIGAVADVAPLADSTRKYQARVAEINPYIDENGMALVKLRLSHTGVIYPGMSCTATLRITSGRSLMVPREAIVMHGDRPVVFSMEQGLANWNYVSLGRTNGKEVEVLGGLKPGIKVITTNNLQLAHHAPVKEGDVETEN